MNPDAGEPDIDPFLADEVGTANFDAGAFAFSDEVRDRDVVAAQNACRFLYRHPFRSGGPATLVNAVAVAIRISRSRVCSLLLAGGSVAKLNDASITAFSTLLRC